MQKQIEQLEKFHNTFGHKINDTPTIPEKDWRKLRHRLLKEEIKELNEAEENGDLVEIADALTDLLYITYGTVLSYGFGDIIEKCFDEVHQSNMSKTDENGNAIFRDDNKILKSDSFEPPQLEKIVKQTLSEEQ